MRILFTVILFLHLLIHLIGFAKANQWDGNCCRFQDDLTNSGVSLAIGLNSSASYYLPVLTKETSLDRDLHSSYYYLPGAYYS